MADPGGVTSRPWFGSCPAKCAIGNSLVIPVCTASLKVHSHFVFIRRELLHELLAK